MSKWKSNDLILYLLVIIIFHSQIYYLCYYLKGVFAKWKGGIDCIELNLIMIAINSAYCVCNKNYIKITLSVGRWLNNWRDFEISQQQKIKLVFFATNSNFIVLISLKPHKSIYPTPLQYLHNPTTLFSQPHCCIFPTPILYLPTPVQYFPIYTTVFSNPTIVFTQPHYCIFSTPLQYFHNPTTVFTHPTTVFTPPLFSQPHYSIFTTPLLYFPNPTTIFCQPQ